MDEPTSQLDPSGSRLVFTYPSGVTALDGVSITIPAGQRLAIVGQNGAGKTTLVRHFNGIFAPTVGTVQIGDGDTKGRDIAALAARVGYVIQNPNEQLFARKIRDEIAIGPKNLGVDKADVELRVTDALHRMARAWCRAPRGAVGRVLGAGGMSTIWEVPVATVGDRELQMSRRLLRSADVEWVPRDPRPSRARHERLPA